MPHDELKARCERHLHVFQAQIAMRGWSDDLCIEILESLYREAMAAGLELAFEEVKNRHWNDKTTARTALKVYVDLENWCRAEAQRVKNGEGRRGQGYTR